MSIQKTITIGAKTGHPLTVKRFGYGSMRLTGEEMIWGEPKNRPEALQILKTAVREDIKFIDTADFYGDDVTNRLIAEALYPYPDDLVICTKVGADRGADKSWRFYDTPENLRAGIENNLKTLKTEQLPLVHLRIMPGSDTPLEESLGAMFEMQKEGKILHVGLSNVSPDELNKGLTMGNIASVENAFGYAQRTTFEMHGMEIRGLQEVMDRCLADKIVMIPFWSLQSSVLKEDRRISEIADKYKVTAAQINLAWTLHLNDLMLPIPGTSKLNHFKENIQALNIPLTDEDMEFLG
ncbi:aldo/keto reductase [Sinomicrobium pectinilyticum]|uniref:Aldo/keto reductase n=1 Tax=Sinomicrobium pectinilyticum TaxID=1084421 RepID=A0A3N0EE25_SINP1|nr:aldo/keto reductase [Sinomicrobium pectinilyticum]RNL85929.1 aldo/keto reductase [Sinomicrobium pectinilyticum]